MGLNLERKNQLQRTSLIDTTVYDGEMMFNQLRKKETYKNLVNQITENLQNFPDG
jgi:predicted methyltransferase MtxX (methanogen marker protein 4)